ncbi:TPA: RNA-processing protein [Candidatus Woesearchaeota archaeon]|nr:RNA-processing protein [Candidatus Woesearchaeota archaeon]HIH31696.1 RNA-processing protein [Candidatus Woesearchaeota archaeon]HIH54959.1 RNA-processing protein [Candidatus Woesearchaeota archaeon]HIJ02652.1 RNA-processing protein [Candidatus Woesearchaeota archaeon]HIJ13610.1 RNA-processing protein [Candidatus Woesearchaeota archaeon]
MPDQEYTYELKISKDRIAVLIGTKGETKKDIEKATGCSINVDSKEGDVIISGKDAVMLFALREVIKAIARGFNPDIAKQLLKQDNLLEVISLNDYSREKNHQQRLKGRVIGMDGKARNTIEDLTECYISVYGKTISIIGKIEMVSICKRAIETLLAGSPHSNVYKWLERQRRLMRKKAFDPEGF